MVISLQIMQYVAVLLGFLAAGVFHHSWTLRRFPPSLFECRLASSDPAALLPVLCLPSSSGRSVWTEGTRAVSLSPQLPPGLLPNWSRFGLPGRELEAVSCHLPGCIWLPALTPRRPLYRLLSLSLCIFFC